jgi:VWFA-related protein
MLHMRWKFGAALMLSAATALPQQATQAPPLPTFSERVEVRVLDLDVDVTDSKGQPVRDLKRENFTVKVGGKAVPIDYFARVDDGTIHAPDLATASPDQVLAAYKKGDEVFVPRNFLVFVDFGFLSPGLRNRSIEAIRDLVTRLGPNDAVRIVSRLISQRQALSLIDSSPRRRGSRLQIARQYAEETGAEIESMLNSMRQELVTLTPLSGKKAFLFLSGGFEYQPGFVLSQYALGGPSLSLVNIRDVSRHLGALVRDANGNEVTFYAVDATGLSGEGATASNDDPLSNRGSVGFLARQDRQTGMIEMARDTGGMALLNTNDFQRGLSRIYQDVSTYYAVGVNLSNLATNAYQDVRVEVDRPGVVVRARRGFQPRKESDVVSDRARATMESDLAYRAIPVRLQTAPPTPGKTYTLPVTVTVPASALTFVPAGDKARAQAEIYFGSVDDKGRMSDVSRQETSFEVPSDKATGDTPLQYNAQLQTRKGNLRIVVNVRDVATGRMGTARANVRVE